MKSTFITVAAFAIGIYAQAPPNLPQCGSMSCMLPAISASGCGFTDSSCLCSKPAFKTALTSCVPSKCTAAADIQSFFTFVNGQCTGQPGYPITNEKSDASPAAPAAPAGSASGGSASSSAAPKAESAAPKPAGASPTAASPKPAAATSAAPKPAQFAGAATTIGFSAGVLAFAGLAQLL